MGVRTGLAVMNYLGQMGVAMGLRRLPLCLHDQHLEFFGRLSPGTISEHFIRVPCTYNTAQQFQYCSGSSLLNQICRRVTYNCSSIPQPCCQSVFHVPAGPRFWLDVGWLQGARC